MKTLREAAQQALEALEEACGNRCNAEYNPCYRRAAADNLRAALAQPEQKPLREDEIDEIYKAIWHNLPSDFEHTSYGWIEQAIRSVEYIHGIE